jgi:hypothetical protein
VRRHSEAAEENASEAPGIDHNAADQAAVLGVAGSPSPSIRASLVPKSKSRAIAEYFRCLSKLDATLLDRVGSYEARLWRQAAQIIWTLDAMRRPPPAPTRRQPRNILLLGCGALPRLR